MCMESATRNCDGSKKATSNTVKAYNHRNTVEMPTGSKSYSGSRNYETPKVKVSFGNRNK